MLYMAEILNGYTDVWTGFRNTGVTCQGLERLVSLNLASLVKYVHLSIYCPASMAAASMQESAIDVFKTVVGISGLKAITKSCSLWSQPSNPASQLSCHEKRSAGGQGTLKTGSPADMHGIARTPAGTEGLCTRKKTGIRCFFPEGRGAPDTRGPPGETG